MAAPTVRAQDQPDAYQVQAPDQSSYGGQPNEQNSQESQSSVARLSYIQGPVSTQRGDSGDWSAATLNTPIMPGDRVSTGADGRAELQLDSSNILRLAENTIVRITDLSPGSMQIEVAQGLASFSSFANSTAVAELDTSNLAIHPWRDGVYRIEFTPDGQTRVAVRRGQAEVGTADGSTTIRAGQLITVEGDSTNAEYQITAAPARDVFDHWSTDRDQIIQRAASWQHLNRKYTGAQDLDNYGTWQNVPDYGDVWTPSVSENWAPYRDGSWVWEPGWGWTWVSYEPWGWAPYHYGRWFLNNGAWAWWPGPVTPFYQPEWAPAYVNFFGFDGWEAGFGGLGWLPIGPWDPFFPWWGGWGHHFGSAGFGRFQDFRGERGFMSPLAAGRPMREGLSNLAGLATNSRLLSGLTAVAASRFGAGRVAGNLLSIGAKALQSAHAFRGAMPVVPRRASLSASGRPAAAGTVPNRNLDGQRFFQHNQPRTAQHSFAAESAQFRQQLDRQHAPMMNARGESPRQAPGRAGSFSQGRANAFSGGAGQSFRQPENSPARFGAQAGAGEQNRAGEWQSFRGNSAPGGQNPGRFSGRENTAPREGWQRFTPQRGTSAGRGDAGAQASPSRPQLNLHKPILQSNRPSYGSSGGSSYRGGGQGRGGGASRPQSFNSMPSAPRGYSTAPNYGAPAAPHGSLGGSHGGDGGSHGGRPHGSSSGGFHGGGGSHFKAPHGGGGSHGGSHGGGSHGGGSRGGHGGHHH